MPVLVFAGWNFSFFNDATHGQLTQQLASDTALDAGIHTQAIKHVAGNADNRKTENEVNNKIQHVCALSVVIVF